MSAGNDKEKYSAKTSYLRPEDALNYESRPVYSGIRGKFRKYRERSIVCRMLKYIDHDSSILDCPCGNGRWFNLLATRAKSIIGMDVSPSMVYVANARKDTSIKTHISFGDAENISLQDNSVDYVFSFALMKHLPLSVKTRILSEYSRVCKQGILCSFAIFNKPAYALWKIRNRDPESYPVSRRELSKLAEESGLSVVNISRIVPGIALECVVYLEKKS